MLADYLAGISLYISLIAGTVDVLACLLAATVHLRVSKVKGGSLRMRGGLLRIVLLIVFVRCLLTGVF